jgi:opacity protein-like surface antigen
MRRYVTSLGVVFSLLFLVTAASAQEEIPVGESMMPEYNTLGISLWTKAYTPIHGSLAQDEKTTDVLKLGPDFGLALRYRLSRSFGFDGTFDFSWMNVAEEYRAEFGEDPAWVMPQITLNATYHVGPALESKRINPYIQAGFGLYPWRITQKGVTGDPALRNGEEFRKTSFGLNAGLGLEFRATERLALFAAGRYNYVFSKDEEKFGTEFDNQGFVGFGAGLTLYIM